MEWNKQAETMMQTWTEAQKKMWEGWFDIMQGGSGNSSMPFSFSPDMMGQWQKTAAQNMETWLAGADPTVQNVGRQLMDSQQMMMRFMQGITQAWQAIAPKMEAGEDWQSVLKEYSGQWVQTMFGIPSGAMSVNKDTNELFQFYMAEWQKMLQPWMMSAMQSPGNFGHLMMGGGSELAQLTKFHWDVYERTFGGMTEIPGLGYNRELNAKILRSFDSWVDMQKASTEYHAALSKTLSESFEAFMQKTVKMAEEGKTIDSMQDLTNLWFDTIDEAFVKMYVSEEYLEIQKKLAAAGMTNKMRQQEVFEVLLGMLDLPTRSELDDAYKSLNEMRREIRSLKKQMKELNPKAKKKIATKPATNGASGASDESVAPEAASPDDLTKIWGIGPKIGQLLNENGYNSFAKLAEANVDDIERVLDESGTRRTAGRELLESWTKQAQLANEGKWDELDALQQEVKSK